MTSFNIANFLQTSHARRFASAIFISLAFVSSVIAAKPVPAKEGAAADDAGYAGHYYLQGVMETGSELLLKPDGRFQWYISYGAADQRAEGRWQRQGEQVVLTADAIGNSAWIRLKESRDWDDGADYSRRRKEYSEQSEAVNARCPFLLAGAAEVSAPVSAGSPDEKSAADLNKAIAQQEARLQEYVKRAEAAAAAAVAASAEAKDAAMRAATQAMSEYWREQYVLKDLNWDKPGPKPAYVKLKMPNECVLPEEPQQPDDPDARKPGLAVYVHDDDSDAYFNEIPVTFFYADGRSEALSTQSGGYAIAQRQNGSKLVALQVGDEETERKGAKPLRIEVPADARAVLQLEFDPEQLTGPAFETFELRIDGRDLVPNWEGRGERGRYSRD